jgi:hypothetical protein
MPVRLNSHRHWVMLRHLLLIRFLPVPLMRIPTLLRRFECEDKHQGPCSRFGCSYESNRTHRPVA